MKPVLNSHMSKADLWTSEKEGSVKGTWKDELYPIKVIFSLPSLKKDCKKEKEKLVIHPGCEPHIGLPVFSAFGALLLLIGVYVVIIIIIVTVSWRKYMYWTRHIHRQSVTQSFLSLNSFPPFVGLPLHPYYSC